MSAACALCPATMPDAGALADHTAVSHAAEVSREIARINAAPRRLVPTLPAPAESGPRLASLPHGATAERMYLGSELVVEISIRVPGQCFNAWFDGEVLTVDALGTATWDRGEWVTDSEDLACESHLLSLLADVYEAIAPEDGGPLDPASLPAGWSR